MKKKLILLPIVSVLLAFVLSGCFVERRPYYYDDYHYRHRYERHHHRDWDDHRGGYWRY
jgi:hypothetical protein